MDSKYRKFLNNHLKNDGIAELTWQQLFPCRVPWNQTRPTFGPKGSRARSPTGSHVPCACIGGRTPAKNIGCQGSPYPEVGWVAIGLQPWRTLLQASSS